MLKSLPLVTRGYNARRFGRKMIPDFVIPAVPLCEPCLNLRRRWCIQPLVAGRRIEARIRPLQREIGDYAQLAGTGS